LSSSFFPFVSLWLCEILLSRTEAQRHKEEKIGEGILLLRYAGETT